MSRGCPIESDHAEAFENNNHSDLVQACRRLAETAENFVNRAPRQKRIETERAALFALSHAQPVLSVTRSPREIDKGGASKREKQQEQTRELEDELKQSQAELVKSRHALEQLDWLMQPMATTLEELQDKAKRAQTIVETALKAPTRVLPFRKSR